MSQPQTITRTLFETLFTRWWSTLVLSVLLLVAISAIRPLGVLVGFGFLTVALLLGVRHGSFAEIGFTRPESWGRTLLLGLSLGVGIQLASSIVLDPLLGRLTGAPVDVSALDGMRGDMAAYVVMLLVGWIVGGLFEEMLFRGYLQKRLLIHLGSGTAGAVVAALVPAVAFGLAHSYQGLAGMLSTGLLGFVFGLLFAWYRYCLWLPILVHGISNTVGITLIYLDGDKVLNGLLFP